jgi:ATP-dependent Lon protease
LKKLKNLDTRDKEYHVGLNYLGTIASLPWSISQEENSNPRNAKIILDRDHFGLEQVKKRIV